jgi:hypothetical protein
MARKTIEVARLRETANRALAYEGYPAERNNADFRQGVIAMVEAALFATDNYRGYRYLASEFEPDGSGTLMDGYDATRREYA